MDTAILVVQLLVSVILLLIILAQVKEGSGGLVRLRPVHRKDQARR